MESHRTPLTLTAAKTVTLFVLFLASGMRAAAVDQPSKSAEVVANLTAALTDLKLDAVAARDPNEPDRFVAALFYPQTQLLVVSARYSAPSLLDARLARKQYRDVYVDLSTSSIPGSRIFYLDMKADGLCSGSSQVPDTVEDGSDSPKIFGPDRTSRKMSESEYQRLYAAADSQYARLLQLLLGQLTRAS